MYEDYSTWFEPIVAGPDSHKDCFVDDYTLYEGKEEQDCTKATKIWANQNAMNEFQGVFYERVTDKKIKDTQSTGELHRTTEFDTDTEYADKSIAYK